MMQSATAPLTRLLATCRLLICLFASCLLAAMLAATAADAAEPVARQPLRQSFDMRVPIAPTSVTVDGAARLVYELHLDNFAEAALLPTRIDISDGARVIASFDGDELARRLAVAAAPGPAGEPFIPPGSRAVAYIEITLPASEIPDALVHRVSYTVAGAAAPEPFVVSGAHVAIGDASVPVLGAPLRGGPWVAIHSPDWPRGHRRVLYTVDGSARIPGRFAIDWVRLDADGRSTRGDADRVDSALGYGAEVLAVADARVAAVRDDIAESTTISAHPDHALADATGNYVALDLGDGRYAFYEHLKPGSIRVAPGQRVHRGEVIAALGFTGDSTGPHLHFHVADANSPLGAEGLPFVFEQFTLLGRYTDIGKLGRAPWTALDDPERAQRRHERPASNVVIAFD